jgi:hypothetical protein
MKIDIRANIVAAICVVSRSGKSNLEGIGSPEGNGMSMQTIRAGIISWCAK